MDDYEITDRYISHKIRQQSITTLLGVVIIFTVAISYLAYTFIFT